MRTTLAKLVCLTLRLSAATALCIAAAAAPAAANSTGKIGASGKQGQNCNQFLCHGGGTPPRVSFTGPDTVDLGQMATFRFAVQTQSAEQTAAGFNVAASAGTLDRLTPPGGVQVLLGELTHNQPRLNDTEGQAAWEFTWTAPAEPGDYTLFGSGNSVIPDGSQGDDAATSTTFVVHVVVPVDTQTPTVPPTGTRTPTATATSTQTHTPTRTETPTPVPGPCMGDCDASGDVDVAEVITGVNIALGTAAPATCPAFGGSAEPPVMVAELIVAVRNAINGCPPPN